MGMSIVKVFDGPAGGGTAGRGFVGVDEWLGCVRWLRRMRAEMATISAVWKKGYDKSRLTVWYENGEFVVLS
jgi:hypothetical protein